MITGAHKDMRLIGAKRCKRTGRKAAGDLRVACQGDMRREWPRIRRKLRLVQRIHKLPVQRVQRGIALDLKDQDAVLCSAEKGKTIFPVHA